MAEEDEKDPTIKIPTEEIVPTIDEEESGIIFDADKYEAYVNNNRSLDADLSLKEKEAQESKDAFAWGAGAAAELTAGFAGTYGYARWAQGGIKVLQGVKGASNLAVVGGPVGIGGKVLTHTVANVGIWALANSLGQGVRTSLSENTKWSAGELLAASMLGGAAGPSSKFGMFVDAKLAKKGKIVVNNASDLVFQIGGKKATESSLFKGSVKVLELGAKGTTRFVGGGSFALAETIIRQELQLILNERESRDTKEWLIAVGLGGTLNVGVRGIADVLSTPKVKQSFSNTYAGRVLMRRSIKKGFKQIDKQKAETEKVIKNLEKNPRNNPDADKPNWNEIDLIAAQKLKLAELNEARYILTDFEKGFAKHSENMGDKVPKSKTEEKTPSEVDEPALIERDTQSEIDELVRDSQKRKKESAENFEKKQQEKKRLEEAGEEVPKDRIEFDDNADFRARAKDIDDYLENKDDELLRKYIRIRQGTEEGSPLGTLKELVDIMEQKLELNTRILDELDYDWAKSGWAKQNRNKGKDFSSDQNAIEISDRAIRTNASLVDQIKAYKEYIKNGETFSDLSAILSGSKLTTGSKSASDLVEEQAKRIKEKIEKVKTKLDEDLVDEATLKSLTPEEIKTKADKDRKTLEAILKDLEKADNIAKEFDIVKNQIDNKLAVSLEEFNALSVKKKNELIKGRAEKLGVTQKKLKQDIEALKKKAKKSSNKLELSAIKREEAEFLRSVKRAYEDGADANWFSKEGAKRSIRGFLYASKLSYIGQVASIIPSITTGVYTVGYRATTRALSRFIAENKKLHPNSFAKKSSKQAWMQSALEVYSSLAMIKELPSIPKSAWRSWKQLKSYTRGGGLEGGYAEAARLGTNVKRDQIRAITERGDKQARAIVGRRNLKERLKKLGEDGIRGAEQAVLLNVRNLTATDDIFFRLLVRQEVESKAGIQALREFPDDMKKMWKRKNELVNEMMPKDADGLRRLEMNDKMEEMWAGINEDIMWNSTHKDYTHKDTIRDAEKLIEGWTKFKKTSRAGFEVEQAELVISPYTSIGIRTALLSYKYMGAPLRVAPGADKIPVLNKMGAGVTTGKNPYKARIDDLSKKIKSKDAMIRQKKFKDSVGDDIPLTPKQIEALRAEKVNLKEQRKSLEAKRIEYNMTEYSRAMASAGLFTLGYTMGGLGIYHGTNMWKTKKQRDNDKIAGISPNSIETPYGPIKNIQSMGSNTSPMNLGASIAKFQKLKANGNLEEDQDYFDVLRANILAPYFDSPVNQGIRAISDAVFDQTFDQEFWASTIGGIVPVPAEVRNFNRLLRGDGKVKDLKGGTFVERAIYEKFGSGLPENEFDVLGRTIDDTRNIPSSLLRWLPYDRKVNLDVETSAYERIALEDTTGILPTRFLPSDKFIYDEKCRNWRNKNGHTFRTIFAERLREEFGGLAEQVNATIEEIGEERFRTESLEDLEDGEMIRGRAAFTVLRNKIIQKAYDNVRESFKVDIDNSEEYLNEYISKDNGDLGFLDYIQERLMNEEIDEAVKRPASNLFQYKFNIK